MVRLPCPCSPACSSNTTACSRYNGASSVADTSGGCADCIANSGLCSAEALAEPALLLGLPNRFLCWGWDWLLLSDCCCGFFECRGRYWLLLGCGHWFLLQGCVDGLLGWLNSRGLDRHLLCRTLYRCLLRRRRNGRLLCTNGLRDHVGIGSQFLVVVLM